MFHNIQVGVTVDEEAIQKTVIQAAAKEEEIVEPKHVATKKSHQPIYGPVPIQGHQHYILINPRAGESLIKYAYVVDTLGGIIEKARVGRI